MGGSVRSILAGAFGLCIAPVLAFALLSDSAMAASEKPLGVVLTADHARLDNASATTGADVFSGDALVTDQAGSMRITIGPSQVYLLAVTSASLEPDGNRVQARVNIGVMGFSTTAPSQFEVQTPLGLIRAADAQPIFGQVNVVNSTKLLVSSFKGTLVFTDSSGDQKLIPQGETYEADLAQDDQNPPPQGGVIPAVHQPVDFKKVAEYAAPFIGAGLLACWLWPESPDHMGCWN
jgi:hypothetical protein